MANQIHEPNGKYRFVSNNSRVVWSIIMLLISIWAKNPISAQTLKQTSIDQAMASLEIKMHGRIGFYAINTANDERFGYHAEERFP